MKLTTTVDGEVTQCGAGDKCYGISQMGTRSAPFGALDDGYAAIAGENISIYGAPDKDVMLEIGVGGCTIGDRLKADSTGRGVTTVTNLDEYGAIAQATAVVGKLCPVQVVFPAQISS